jgi:RNA polymerase sigma-70 factor, ECF subfamily
VPIDRAQLLRDLHDGHAGAVWGMALHWTGGDRGRAEDVVQETLLRAWQSPRLLEASDAARRAWLLTVARNLLIDEWRSAHHRREVATDRLPEPAADSDTDAVLQAWLVTDALARLSPDHRRVLQECYYRGRSVAEAARVLGVPEGTVKSRTHYALRAMRLVLQEMGVTR